MSCRYVAALPSILQCTGPIIDPFVSTSQDVGPGSDMAISKMAEKYSRNPSRKAHEDVAKRTYYICEGRVRTVYHYDDPRVTRKASVVYKERATASAGTTAIAADDIAEYDEDSLQQALQGEKECFAAIRHSQLEMAKLSEKRSREEQTIKIERPIFDRVYDR